MTLRAGAVDVPGRLHLRGDLDGRLGLLRHAGGRAMRLLVLLPEGLCLRFGRPGGERAGDALREGVRHP